MVIHRIILHGVGAGIIGMIVLCGAAHADGNSAGGLFFKGRSRQALKEYVRRLKKDPRNENLLKNIVCLSSDLQSIKHKVTSLNNLRSGFPGSHWGFRESGWHALSRGDIEKASGYFKQALQLKPLDHRSLLGAGLAYHLQEKWDEAGSVYTVLQRCYSSSAPAYFLKGMIDHVKGNYEAGQQQFAAALKEDYASPEIRFSRVRQYIESGNVAAAWKGINKLLNIDPSSVVVKKMYASEMFARLREKPKVISPGKRIAYHKPVVPIKDPLTVPSITIGLAVDGKGRPQKIVDVHFNFRGTCSLEMSSGTSVHVSSNQYREWTVRVSSTPWGIVLIDDAGNLSAQTTGMITIQPDDSKGTVIIRGVPFATGYSWAGRRDREYRGMIFIKRYKDRLIVVNKVRLEEYLFSVLPSEMISSWPEEALKSQAVIARCFAWFKMKHPVHKKYGYDICSDQHCQVYAGTSNERARTNSAVAATRGVILNYRNRVVNTLYSSNCGGHTQSSRDLKGWGDEPYLRGSPDMKEPGAYPKDPVELFEWIYNAQPDCYCAPSEYTFAAESRWIRVVPAYLVNERIDRRYKTGKVKDIIIARRSPSGHIRKLIVEGDKKKAAIEKENRIRGVFAPGGLRSTYYTLDVVRYKGKPQFFVFFGGGWGHTIGLCQSGAAGMADTGATYREILSHYYKDTKIKKMAW